MAQSISVSVSETYDLSTTKDRLGLIAIRTPSMIAVNKRYPGFIRNFKFLKVKSADVVLSCASSLPADPLQIGTTAGAIAPQDMFNPLLYKAVSNDSWNGLINRIYAGGLGLSSDSLGGSVRYFQDAFPQSSNSDCMAMYYSLLSDPSFKKAHVQSGLEMRHLIPLVYHLLSSGGVVPANNGAQIAGNASMNDQVYIGSNNIAGTSSILAYNGAGSMKGRPVPMPPVECTPSVYHETQDNVVRGEWTPTVGNIVPTYVGCIIVPPASLNITYFRMTIRWNLEFFGVASDIAKALPTSAVAISPYTYFSNQQTQQTLQASKISDVSDTAVNADGDDGFARSVEADGVTLDLIMEH
ncbi:putative capsid protein [Porcine associated porprismacovirus 10]|uniref:Putative capsid protein n=1 Tax=Porcine associated porprismacovirus 10 TaxID=2170117 RepID=A0A160HWH5_9VIRU|nr:putative capsid protein [Porcine associated porprismacovirus 10]ANC51537.1 putative capsid protein [Porcine associated porprismacovirus 10]